MAGGASAMAEGTLLQGRYRIDRVVAEGGFGVVYRAHHLTLNVPVAIKLLTFDVLKDDFADKTVRFLEEARMVGKLRHPHIVRVLDVGVTPASDGAPPQAWLVMEWCEGRTLRDDLRARDGEPRSVEQTWSLMRPLIDAVATAHAASIVHRDIKPSNIMMVEEPDTPLSARLIDFGIAKKVDLPVAATMTTASTGPSMFTPGYAAPEQLVGNKTGPWTDVHALGLVLTEMLTGQAPYGAEVEPAAILDPTRPTPKTFEVDVGPWEVVLAKATALRTSERYRDAAAFVAALEAAYEEAAASASLPRSRRRAPAPAAGARADSSEQDSGVSGRTPMQKGSTLRSQTAESKTLGAVSSEPPRAQTPTVRGRSGRWWLVAGGAVAVGAASVALTVASSRSDTTARSSGVSSPAPVESAVASVRQPTQTTAVEPAPSISASATVAATTTAIEHRKPATSPRPPPAATTPSATVTTPRPSATEAQPTLR